MHCRKKQRTHQPFNPSLEGSPGPSSIRWGLFEEIMHVTHGSLQPSQGKSKIEMRWLWRLSGGAFCLTNWILEKCIGDSQYSWVIASEILTAWITRGNERKQSDWKFYVQEISLKITQLQICSILHERGRMTQTAKLRAEPHTQRMEQRVQRAELWTTEDYSQGLKPSDFSLVGSQYFLQPVIFLFLFHPLPLFLNKNDYKSYPLSVPQLLESHLESPLDSKEIKPVNSKRNQPWIFIERTDAGAEAPILWPHIAKGWLIGEDPDAGKDWRQEEKGMTEDDMVGWHHWLNQWTWIWANSGRQRRTGKPGVLQSMRSQSQTSLSDLTTCFLFSQIHRQKNFASNELYWDLLPKHNLRNEI